MEPPSLHLGGELISGRVADRLVEEIRHGCYAGLDRLPPEVALAQRLGVSRTAVRDALSELEQAGYVERVRGIGTVIHRAVAGLDSRMDQKLEFTRMIAAAGCQARQDHLTVTRQTASPRTSALLGLEPGQTVLVVCKRLLADARPVLYSTDILPLSLFGGHLPEAQTFGQPVFELLQQCCGSQISSTIAHPHAITGTPAVRRLLELKPGQALLELEEVCYDRLCRPVLRSQTCYTDFFDFSLVRKLV